VIFPFYFYYFFPSTDPSIDNLEKHSLEIIVFSAIFLRINEIYLAEFLCQIGFYKMRDYALKLALAVVFFQIS
jgi:hypothetical protein